MEGWKEDFGKYNKKYEEYGFPEVKIIKFTQKDTKFIQTCSKKYLKKIRKTFDF